MRTGCCRLQCLQPINKYVFCIVFLLCYTLGAHASRPFGSLPIASQRGNRTASGRVDDSVKDVLRSLWRAPLALQTPEAEIILKSGFKHEVQGRNWKRLAQKLATPGATVNVLAFGGSITVGHYNTCENSSWVEEMMQWMEMAFPQITFQFQNHGHGATTAAVASLCYYQNTPADADLVLVEYSVNGCGALQCLRVSQPEVAAYEVLLRKIFLKAPHAALMAFAAFPFRVEEANEIRGGGEEFTPYYMTGEDQHGIIARRYGVPMVSVRDALYDIMFDDDAAIRQLGMTRQELMMDKAHPTLPGAKLYGAGLVAWGIRHMVTTALLQHHQHSRLHVRPHSPSRVTDATGALTHPQLPRCITPLAAQQVDGESQCFAGTDISSRVLHSNGWEWVDEGRSTCTEPGCRKYGWMSHTVGSHIDFIVDSASVLSQEQRDAGLRVGLVLLFMRSKLAQQADEGLAESLGMGVASIECVSGCRCFANKVDGVNDDFSSELDTVWMRVSPHPQCVVRATILNETSSGGHKFRINGLALAPYDVSVPKTVLNRMVMRKDVLLATEKALS